MITGGPLVEQRTCAVAEIDVFEQRTSAGPAGWASAVKRRARRRGRHRSRLALNTVGRAIPVQPDEHCPARPVGKRERRRRSAQGSVLVWSTQTSAPRRKRRLVTRYVTCGTCFYERRWWEPCGLPCA